jgi:alkanesulfonate monooxygenase SsuD/methylene tetrahydromethanopterin reductase-like flavin-dependent oxidoreductase (luciferase family)
MFRKLFLAAVASLGLLSALALPASANAHEYHHHHVYRVYYRDPYRPVWIFAGSFRERRLAVRFAEQYRCRGFAVSIY